jgi:recombination protein RecT
MNQQVARTTARTPQRQAAPGRQNAAVTLIDGLRSDLEKMRPQFAMALGGPAEKVDRFTRVIMTAIQNNPKLLQCERRSLLNAAMKAAQDDLLPDGREGAIVPFGENEDGQKKSDQAQWMPMIAGLRKKARNSGLLVDWYCEVVHDGDHYVYEKGDEARIEHTPSRGSRTRPIIAAYSIAKFKDGSISREWMWIEEIEDVRKEYSRAKRGPWANPVSYPEMCKKTVARLHAKTLPSSTDLDAVLRRDDVLYNPEGGGQVRAARERAAIARPANANAALAHFGSAAGADDEGDELDPRPGDGQVIEHEHENPAPGESGEEVGPSAADIFATNIAKAAKHPPKNRAAFEALTLTLINIARDMGPEAGADALAAWWPSEATRKLRNGAGMTADETATLYDMVKQAVEELRQGVAA